MSDNNAALASVTASNANLAAALQANATAITDAANALKDLASRSAGGEDISAPLTALAGTMQGEADALNSTASSLEADVTAVGEPVTGVTGTAVGERTLRTEARGPRFNPAQTPGGTPVPANPNAEVQGANPPPGQRK